MYLQGQIRGPFPNQKSLKIMKNSQFCHFKLGIFISKLQNIFPIQGKRSYYHDYKNTASRTLLIFTSLLLDAFNRLYFHISFLPSWPGGRSVTVLGELPGGRGGISGGWGLLFKLCCDVLRWAVKA